MDIKQSDTLQRTSARDEKDERHISRFRKRQESVMELSEYTVGSLRNLRGKRNASTETGICAELVNTVHLTQEKAATIF